MGIDYDLINEALRINSIGLLKLIVVSFFIFYWIPSKIFPQDFMRDGLDKVLYNALYSLSFSILVIPPLIFFKIFSIAIYIFALLGVKILFIVYYEKRNLWVVLSDLNKKIMISIFDFFDNNGKFWKEYREKKSKQVKDFYAKSTIYKFFLKQFYVIVFVYAIFNIGFQSMVTFGDASPDNAFFITWVTFMKENVLWSDLNTFGADFFGVPTFVFSLSMWSNIDSIILFKIYPILLIAFYHFGLYYVFYRLFNSRFSALFGIIVVSLVFYSPLSQYFAGEEFTTQTPIIKTLFNMFSFYYTDSDVIKNATPLMYSHIPYTRFVAGLGYEFSGSMFLLNLYFFARLLENKTNHSLLLYCMTLFLVFSFHGGGAIFLLPASLLVLLNGFLFKKITWELFKRGLVAILVTTILGNLWALAMFKYGLLENVGNALPILDELLGNERNAIRVQQTGGEVAYLLLLQPLQYVMMALVPLSAFASYFARKEKFVISSLTLAMVAVSLIFYLPHMGASRLVAYSRGIEYMYTSFVLIFVFLFYYIVNLPLKKLLKKYYAMVMLTIFYVAFILASVTFPKWYIDNDKYPDYVSETLYPKNVESIGYSSSAKVILDINNLYRPFTWTLVSYIQEYSKAKDKGYHMNLHNFLTKYDPRDEYLKIPTKYIFLIEEVSPNSYKGLSEWWYRWKRDIEDNLRSWIALYRTYHGTIRLFESTKNVNVYIIDNQKYLDYLRKQEREKNGNLR